MFEKIRKLFCWHDYRYVSFHEAEDDGVRYSMRTYRCEKCGKTICVDARYKNTAQPRKPLVGWFAV